MSDNNQELICLAEKLIVGARSDINRPGMLSLRIQRSGTYEAASQFLVPTLHTVLDDLYSEASYAMQNFHDSRNMSLMEKF